MQERRNSIALAMQLRLFLHLPIDRSVKVKQNSLVNWWINASLRQLFPQNSDGKNMHLLIKGWEKVVIH